VCNECIAGQRCAEHQNTPAHAREKFEYVHSLGRACLHIGRHRHGAHAILSGERYNLVHPFSATLSFHALMICLTYSAILSIHTLTTSLKYSAILSIHALTTSLTYSLTSPRTHDMFDRFFGAEAVALEIVVGEMRMVLGVVGETSCHSKSQSLVGCK
jgi:hypothetical protein